MTRPRAIRGDDLRRALAQDAARLRQTFLE